MSACSWAGGTLLWTQWLPEGHLFLIFMKAQHGLAVLIYRNHPQRPSHVTWVTWGPGGGKHWKEKSCPCPRLDLSCHKVLAVVDPKRSRFFCPLGLCDSFIYSNPFNYLSWACFYYQEATVYQTQLFKRLYLKVIRGLEDKNHVTLQEVEDTKKQEGLTGAPNVGYTSFSTCPGSISYVSQPNS